MRKEVHSGKWRRGESNPRHSACEADALPLSYAPDVKHRIKLQYSHSLRLETIKYKKYRSTRSNLTSQS